MNARLVGADIMLKTGRLDSARDALNSVRGDLYDLRKASGVVVLADCVRDANATMDALMTYNVIVRSIGTTPKSGPGSSKRPTDMVPCSIVVTRLPARPCARRLSFVGWSMVLKPACCSYRRLLRPGTQTCSTGS